MNLREVIVGTALMVFASSATAGYDEGVAAYKKGDFKTALHELKPLAEQGNLNAQFNLGVMYGKGQGVPQDYKEAVKWYRLAAEQGDARVQYEVGLQFSFGRGAPEDNKEAKKWFRLAAEQGFAHAQTMIGVWYYVGIDMPTDYKEAYAWFSAAAANGSSEAFDKRDEAARELTPAQLAEAQALAKQYFEKYQPKP